jgi:hypothetical protein
VQLTGDSWITEGVEMLFFLNVTIITVGAATAGAAIFGDTHADGRLTKIGWIAIVGCVMTFIIGVAKERVTQQDAWAFEGKIDELLKRT